MHFLGHRVTEEENLCVVEEATNIQAVEKTRQFDGLYHVLGGAFHRCKGSGRIN